MSGFGKKWREIGLLLVGGGLVTLGLGMIYLPLAPIALGAALVLEVLTTGGDR